MKRPDGRPHSSVTSSAEALALRWAHALAEDLRRQIDEWLIELPPSDDKRLAGQQLVIEFYPESDQTDRRGLHLAWRVEPIPEEDE